MLPQASMWPRFNERGSGRHETHDARRHGLQCGRASMSAEGSCGAIRCWLASRFNVAAASMSAEDEGVHAILALLDSLQCGRASMSAEGNEREHNESWRKSFNVAALQ